MNGDRPLVEREYQVYEVFSQKSPTSNFESQFSLLAPNPEVALTMAQENFLRRDEEVYNLFVVKREDMHFISPDQRDMLYRMDNKSYRMAKHYTHVVKKWKELEEKAKDRLVKELKIEG